MTASSDEHGCRFEAEGRFVAEGSPAQVEAMLVGAARRWKGRSVVILAGTDIPYRCVGQAVFVLQRELVGGRIGFIAEPPPDRE